MVRGPKKKVVLNKKEEKDSVYSTIFDEDEYRNGAEGMIKFIEDHVFISIYPDDSEIAKWVRIRDLPTSKNPKTGKTYDNIWNQQKEVLREALIMENGRFVHNLIILCWPRGEGKSLLACLIQIWKFFCFPRQQIMLGANSKDQTKFVHYDIIRDIILNSPSLLRKVGRTNIQEKEIHLRDKQGRITSAIRSISSFSGIVSNITGFTFSEMFDMKNPKFFTQLYGSIRNITNSLGVIDSTVSEKTHVLYQLYLNVIGGKTKKVFYSYRCSKNSDPNDYWNPNMDADQLSDYKVNFPFGEFERYFQNLWSAGTTDIFTQEMVEETKIIGYNGKLMNHGEIAGGLESLYKFEDVMVDMRKKRNYSAIDDIQNEIVSLQHKFKYVNELYSLKDRYGRPTMCSMDKLVMLGDLFDTDFAIVGGTDFADPMAVRVKARTIGCVFAKGLIGSRKNPMMLGQVESPNYIYFLLMLVHAENHDLNILKNTFELAHDEFDGIDTICSERYGAWDLALWCEERDIAFEPIYPNYDRQKEAFGELYNVVRKGNFKRPSIGVTGSKKEDIIDEEMTIFDHDVGKRWFGSPEKHEKHGIQDDCVYAFAWSLYGGRNLTTEDFRIRGRSNNFGIFMPQRGLVATY